MWWLKGLSHVHIEPGARTTAIVFLKNLTKQNLPEHQLTRLRSYGVNVGWNIGAASVDCVSSSSCDVLRRRRTWSWSGLTRSRSRCVADWWRVSRARRRGPPTRMPPRNLSSWSYRPSWTAPAVDDRSISLPAESFTFTIRTDNHNNKYRVAEKVRPLLSLLTSVNRLKTNLHKFCQLAKKYFVFWYFKYFFKRIYSENTFITILWAIQNTLNTIFLASLFLTQISNFIIVFNALVFFPFNHLYNKKAFSFRVYFSRSLSQLGLSMNKERRITSLPQYLPIIVGSLCCTS